MLIILIANKTDLNQDIEVSSATGRDFAVKHGCVFFETSAIKGKGTDEAFMKIVEECIELQNKRNEINRRALTLAVNSKENSHSIDR